MNHQVLMEIPSGSASGAYPMLHHALPDPRNSKNSHEARATMRRVSETDSSAQGPQRVLGLRSYETAGVDAQVPSGDGAWPGVAAWCGRA